MTVLKGLFGSSDAEKQAEEQRELNAVANDRQMAEVNRQNDALAATRRAPRGRRLFEDGPAPGNAKTLGAA